MQVTTAKLCCSDVFSRRFVRSIRRSFRVSTGRRGRVVRCRIAMPKVVSSIPGRGKINLQTWAVMENCKYLPLFCLSYVLYAFGYGF